MILAARDRRTFAFDEIDIETDDDLLRAYGIRIPVVTVDGEERFEITVDPSELERELLAPPAMREDRSPP